MLHLPIRHATLSYKNIAPKSRVPFIWYSKRNHASPSGSGSKYPEKFYNEKAWDTGAGIRVSQGALYAIPERTAYKMLTNLTNRKVKDSSAKLIFKDAMLCAQFLRGYVDIPALKDVQPEDIEDVTERYVHMFTEERDSDVVKRVHSRLNVPEEEKPEYVFLAAARVGGIMGNATAKADFLYENMILEMNVIHSAWKNDCRKLEFLGSSCIYPRMAPQPMPERCLLTSSLEQTNEAYALAKISGLKYCEYLNSSPCLPMRSRVL